VQHLKSLELKKKAKRMLKQQYLGSSASVFHLWRSISAGMRKGCGHPGITQTLMDLYSDFIPLPIDGYYAAWLVSAIENRYMDTLKILLNMNHQSSWNGSSRVFGAACETKN
jgi:hypothetical protein